MVLMKIAFNTNEKDYEAMEVARVRLLKGAITSFVEAQAAIPPKTKNSCEVMKAKADAVNVDGDMQSYISSTRTGQSKPARTQYQPYDSALGACKPPSGGGGGGFSPPPSSTPMPTSAERVPPKGPTMFTAPSPRPPMGGGFGPGPAIVPPRDTKPAASHPNTAGASTFKVKALYAYTGTEDTELSFEEGLLCVLCVVLSVALCCLLSLLLLKQITSILRYQGILSQSRTEMKADGGRVS